MTIALGFAAGLGLGGLGGFLLASRFLPRVIDLMGKAIDKAAVSVTYPGFRAVDIEQAAEPSVQAYADDGQEEQLLPVFLRDAPADWDGADE